MTRISCPELAAKVMTAVDAAAFINPGDSVGMSGFTGAGYPKMVPQELARRIERAHGNGEDFKIGLWTGASTAPEVDGALADVHGIDKRLPYNSDPKLRALINAGEVDYVDA
ncbi:MAG: propionyl-CoA--succinate CoA transferase, partial [Propionibacteriales bacterium]|nr:propionyl-CoA--succinate CoA transferase [Propionibacteriales bacterium]